MKRAFNRTFAVLAMTALSTFNVASQAIAVQFGQYEVQQDRFIAMAVPRAFGHSLVIVEQVSNSRPCWNESGSSPTVVDPLLLSFDFTGICGRATDSNGYSVRMGEQDLVMSHTLNVRGVGNELLLVATSRVNPHDQPIVIGRTYGLSDGFTKIVLEPGWRFTKRTYQGQTLGHIYFTHDYTTTAYSQSINPTTNNGTSTRANNGTSNKPDSTTANKPDSTTANKPDSTTANKPDSTTANKPDSTTANKPDSTTANKPDSTTANKPDSTTANKPDSTTAENVDFTSLANLLNRILNSRSR